VTDSARRYSTLWLAETAPPDAAVLGIDGDPEHVILAEQLVDPGVFQLLRELLRMEGIAPHRPRLHLE